MPPARQFIAASEAQPPFFVGVDLGGTSVKVGVVDDLGQVLSWLSVPTLVERGPEEATVRTADAVRQAIEQAGLPTKKIAALGLGTPGTMDIPAGKLLTPGNLPGWWHFPIRDRLSHHCGLPVSYANDAAAAGYGEFWIGSGRLFQSMVMFTLGTGVGGAIFIGDLSIDGDHSNGAELGHITIDCNDDARLCSCGKRGHLEAYVGAPAVVRRTAERLARGTGPTSSLTGRAARQALTPLVVAEEAERGDALALEIVLDTARYLGVAIVNLIHTIDPSGVVIGGAMTFGGNSSPVGQQFLARVTAEVHERAIPDLRDKTTIDFASLGADAGFIGAAGIARSALLKH